MVASTPQRLISRPPTEEPDLFASPGMLQLLDSVGNPASLSNVCSRGDILRAPSHAFGPRTKLFKSEAISSILSNPISTRAKRKRTFTDDVEPSDLEEPTLKARHAAMRLLPLLPESCFIDMAGGIKGYNATPAAERQQANLRTLCKAVGRNGDTGVRLATLISKLVDYRHQHHVTGDMWPLFPAILSNFAIWLQNNSKKSVSGPVVSALSVVRSIPGLAMDVVCIGFLTNCAVTKSHRDLACPTSAPLNCRVKSDWTARCVHTKARYRQL